MSSFENFSFCEERLLIESTLRLQRFRRSTAAAAAAAGSRGGGRSTLNERE